jgi:hypothetical protein
MAATKTSRNASKPKTSTPKRKPAAQSATTSSTRPSSRVAQVQQLAERAVLIPVGAALEARDRVVDLVSTTRTQLEREVRRTRRNLGSNVEAVSSRVEAVVQNGVNVGIKLVNGAQDRLSRAA